MHVHFSHSLWRQVCTLSSIMMFVEITMTWTDSDVQKTHMFCATLTLPASFLLVSLLLLDRCFYTKRLSEQTHIRSKVGFRTQGSNRRHYSLLLPKRSLYQKLILATNYKSCVQPVLSSFLISLNELMNQFDIWHLSELTSVMFFLLSEKNMRRLDNVHQCGCIMGSL